MEPRYNEPLYNEVLDITNDILQPGKITSKMYVKEPRYKEILDITNTIQQPWRKIYLDITNKCQHARDNYKRWMRNRPTAILTFNSVNSSLKHMYLSTDPLYSLCLLLVLQMLFVQTRKCWVVRHNTATKQLLTIPQYNEHLGCFSAKSL